MKKQIYPFVLLWSLFYTPLFSQTFSLIGKLNYYPTTTENVSNERELSYLSPLTDTTATRSLIRSINTVTKTYEPELGYELKGILTFPIGKKIGIRTGVGINYLRFSSSSEIVESLQETLFSEIISYSFGNNGFSYCDVYTNSFSDVGPIDGGISQSLFHLIIPLEVDYQLIPNFLSIRPSLVLQTPLFSQRERSYISTTREFIQNEAHCTYEKITENDRSGEGIRDFQLRYGIAVAYTVTSKITVSLNASKNWNSTFVDAEYQSYPYGDEKFQPMNFGIEVEYHFSKSKSIEVND